MPSTFARVRSPLTDSPWRNGPAAERRRSQKENLKRRRRGGNFTKFMNAEVEAFTDVAALCDGCKVVVWKS